MSSDVMAVFYYGRFWEWLIWGLPVATGGVVTWEWLIWGLPVADAGVVIEGLSPPVVIQSRVGCKNFKY